MGSAFRQKYFGVQILEFKAVFESGQIKVQKQRDIKNCLLIEDVEEDPEDDM